MQALLRQLHDIVLGPNVETNKDSGFKGLMDAHFRSDESDDANPQEGPNKLFKPHIDVLNQGIGNR